jgi:hypothetical protein
MPGRDQSGPKGLGPMTGRALGICNRAQSGGFGRMGMRRRNRNYSGYIHTESPVYREYPEEQNASSVSMLTALMKRMEALEKKIEDLQK